MERCDGYLLTGTMLEVYEQAPFWAANGCRRAVGSSLSVWLLDEACIADTVVSGIAIVTLKLATTDPVEHCGKLILVEEEAHPEQVRWIVDALQGRLGGPLAEAAALLHPGPPAPASNALGFYQVPISYHFQQRSAVIEVPKMLRVVASGADLEPVGTGADGQTGPLNRLFPDWSGQATEASVDISDLHLKGDLSGCAAVRGSFRFEG